MGGFNAQWLKTRRITKGCAFWGVLTMADHI